MMDFSKYKVGDVWVAPTKERVPDDKFGAVKRAMEEALRAAGLVGMVTREDPSRSGEREPYFEVHRIKVMVTGRAGTDRE